MYKEKSNCCSCFFSILSSLLVAAGISAVFYTGIVTAIPVLIYITLVLGILAFIGLIVLACCGKRFLCSCANTTTIVASSVGAIISSSFALAITTLATFSVPVAILIGVVAFFLVSLIISVIELLLCIFCNTKNCYYED